MRWFSLLLVSLFFLLGRLSAYDPEKKAPLKIIPGKVIVPTDAMRRPWGELLTLDLKKRTGTFRNESNDEVMPAVHRLALRRITAPRGVRRSAGLPHRRASHLSSASER